MAYDLTVQGYVDFGRFTHILEQQKISRDPLSGVLDGANQVFHTNYFPIVTSGSVLVYTSGSLTAGTVDTDTGEITLAVVPTSQPFATYTFTPYTTQQTLSFMLRGFDRMESFWFRGWSVVNGSGLPADESDSHLYIVDSAGNDPTISSYYFSQSRSQIALFMACCEYDFIRARFLQAAGSDYMYRETVRGMTVDKSKRPMALKAAVDQAKSDLDDILDAAQREVYGDPYGAAILNPATAGYMANDEWQTESLDADYRGTLATNGGFGLRYLTYP